MLSYLRRRILQAFPTFFGVTFVAFMLILSAPGDPVALITFNPQASDTESAERLRRQLGLDQPPLIQYVYWLIGNDWTQIDANGDGTLDSPGTRLGLLRGDLGQHLRRGLGEPVGVGGRGEPEQDLIRAEILYWETMADRYPNFAAGAILDDQIRAKTATRTLVVADTSSTASLFASNLVYAKGSAVLHMLRSVLGDEAFREMLHQYIADPSLRYGTATTADLQRVAESVSGIDLDDFFRQWVTVDFGYPKYEVLYSASPATAGRPTTPRPRRA